MPEMITFFTKPLKTRMNLCKSNHVLILNNNFENQNHRKNYDFKIISKSSLEI